MLCRIGKKFYLYGGIIKGSNKRVARKSFNKPEILIYFCKLFKLAVATKLAKKIRFVLGTDIPFFIATTDIAEGQEGKVHVWELKNLHCAEIQNLTKKDTTQHTSDKG